MEERAMTVLEQRWLQTMHQANQSGQQIWEWCRENGVAESTYYRWKQRLKSYALKQLKPEALVQRPVSGDQQASFVRLEDVGVKGEEETTDNLLLHMDRQLLEIPTNISEQNLLRILQAVKHAW